MASTDYEYYARREREERKRADVTADPAIGRVHRELAGLHDARVRALTEGATA